MSELGDRIAQSTRRSPYFAKDLRKAHRANLFIGRGSAQSSTEAYRRAAGELANVGKYEPTDVVFVSAEGARRGRIAPDYNELNRATAHHAIIITDDAANRARPYNIGEREVAAYLTERGYIEFEPGTWRQE